MLPGFAILFGISGGELLIIFLLALLVFGPGKIPEIARMIAKGVNEVKKVQREINSEIHRYSGDIEREARQMQRGIDDLKNDLLNPMDVKLSVTDDFDKSIPDVYEQPDILEVSDSNQDMPVVSDKGAEEIEQPPLEKIRKRPRSKISATIAPASSDSPDDKGNQ